MPAGRKPIPIAIHQLHGTYRADRHAGALATEKAVSAPKWDATYCGFCGHSDWFLAGSHQSDASICATCRLGAVNTLVGHIAWLPEALREALKADGDK